MRASAARSPARWRTACGRSRRSASAPTSVGRGATAAVIDRQLRAAIGRLERLAGTGLVIAYEPVWAIGTGDAASAEDAQEVCAQIREILRETDPAAADEIPIQYGGSVTAENAAELFGQPDIDGALVGGASLKPDVFAQILRAAAGT